MNKKIFTGALLSVAMLSQAVTVSLAVSPSPTTRAQERQENREEHRVSVLEKIATRVEARFKMHKERLQSWIDRASDRISKLKAKGKDTTNAEKALETAKTSLATASTLGDQAVAMLRAVKVEDWTSQKADAKAAREAVMKAQVAYAHVILDFRTELLALKTASK